LTEQPRGQIGRDADLSSLFIAMTVRTAIAERLSRIIAGTNGKKEALPYTGASYGDFAIPVGMSAQSYLQMYGQVGWLFGAVSRIAEAVADTEWKLYKVTGEERKEIVGHPITNILNQVNPFMTGNELLEIHQMYMELIGESFWYIARGKSTGRPQEIWPLPPTRMRIVPDAQEYIKGYVYEFGTHRIPLETSEVIFIKRNNPADPFRGIGVTQSIGVDLQSERYAAQWNRNFFYNSATPQAAVMYKDDISPEEFKRLKEQWNSQYRGVGNAHKMAIIGGDAKIEKIAFSQRDMDFWRQRKLNRDTILGAFGIPASVMGVSENVNRANAESGEFVFARWVIKPRLTRLRDKLNEQFIPLFGDRSLELDFGEPVPENRELLLRESTEGVKAGILTVNEGRGMLGLDAVKSGDVFLVPMNMMPIRADQAEIQMPTPATPAPKLMAGKVALANDDQKEVYWRVFVLKTEQQEKPIKNKLVGLFNDQEKKVLAKLPKANKPADVFFNMREAKKDFKDALEPMLGKVMADAIEDAEDLVRPENPHTEEYKQPVSDDALIWLQDHSAELVTAINETTRESLKVVLTDGFAEGEGIPQLAKRIRGVFDDATRRRSFLIARTETIQASAQGHIEGYKNVGIAQVEFFAALDERVCPACESLHGSTYEASEAEGIIVVHPQCRCVWIPVVD
tara:strand:+ start:6560 stop:8605 length:2046 start_codon:yes stop_codon:yes gene_type:complete